MNKRNIILAAFFLVVILTGFVSAADTVINVRTVSVHKAVVTVLGAGEGYTFLDSFFKDTGDSGELAVTYSGGQDEIKVNVLISKDGSKIMLEKFGPFPAGEPIYLQVIPGKVSDNYKAMDEAKATEAAAAPEVVEEPEEDTAEPEVVEETEEENKGITGSAIFSKKIVIPKAIYYVVGGILLVGVLLIVVMKFGPSIKGSIPRSVPKSGSSPGFLGASEKSSEVARLEGQLKEAKVEIEKMKKMEANREKISEVERRLALDRAELQKLKNSGD
ncbi:hypothetical protein CMI45_01645 [Candidatus Pacearchaeota archaeon]|nr:hypothetical protein [Candidatus Pacearchaeota archaeon]|tara:strand:+ start:482 stop:1303 length:822 start_codon:yes stop_codon:yes gene_type:complete